MGVKLCLPPLKWSTDNAAMIGLAAWDYLNAGVIPPLSATASLPITEF
jgi:N6-L-threonylcarbamoyladenine synthase